MGSVESTKQALQKKDEPIDLVALIKKAASELSLALPEHMRAERLVRIATTNIRQVPQLANCTPESFLGALFTAAQLGIEPIAGRAYILPFYNSKKKPDGSWHKVLEAQFLIGYKGLAELFYRHEKAVMLNWGIVKAGDEFKYELGTEAYLKHIPAQERGETLGFYVIADLGKAKPFLYMTLTECLEHGRKHSKTYDKKTDRFYDSSPWATNRDAMCLKTVLIQLCKVLPLSFEIQRAIENDETSREYRKGVKDILDTPSTTSWQEPPAAIDAPKEKDPDDPGEPPANSKSSSDIPFGE